MAPKLKSRDQVSTKSMLLKTSATMELAKLDRDRTIVQAAAEGMSQREIAAAANTTQPVVHRVLKRAQYLRQDSSQQNPHETVLRRAAGQQSGTVFEAHPGARRFVESSRQITNEQMWDALSAITFTVGYVPTVDGHMTDAYMPGTWDEVRRAHMRGLLTDNEFERLSIEA